MRFRILDSVENADWLEMRQALWPAPRERHVEEMRRWVASPDTKFALIAMDEETPRRGSWNALSENTQTNVILVQLVS